jgi:hypothetical protein
MLTNVANWRRYKFRQLSIFVNLNGHSISLIYNRFVLHYLLRCGSDAWYGCLPRREILTFSYKRKEKRVSTSREPERPVLSEGRPIHLPRAARIIARRFGPAPRRSPVFETDATGESTAGTSLKGAQANFPWATG